MAAARFNNAPEVWEEYVEKTQIGKLLFAEEKIAQYKAFIEEQLQGNEDGQEFLEYIGRLGLELEDLYALLSSNIGIAVVNQEVPGLPPMPTFLLWSEMEQGAAERVYGAILEAVIEEENIERVDQEMGDAPASRIRDLTDGSSFLLALLENRFHFAIGYTVEPIDPEAFEESQKAYEEAEWDALGTFLQAQRNEGGEFLSNFYSDSGIASVRPDFDARMEVLGDLGALFHYLPRHSVQNFDKLGLRQFDKLAFWGAFDNMEEKTVAFLGVPSPRNGLASLIDMDAFDFQPPAWVPSSVASYASFAVNMEKVYDAIIQTAKNASSPEMVDQHLQVTNEQLQLHLQTDIETIISGFGSRIRYIEFPIEIAEVEDFMGTITEEPLSPQIMVWDFNKPEILQTAMGMATAMSGGPDSPVQIVDELGFHGMRVESPDGTVVLAYGLGKIVLAIGPESTASRIFSALNNPPEGEDALINDAEYRDFIASNPTKAGTAFSYAQGDEVLKNLIPVAEWFNDTMKKVSNEKLGLALDALFELFPSEEELDGTLGAVFSRMHHTDAGLVIEGSSQYR